MTAYSLSIFVCLLQSMSVSVNLNSECSTEMYILIK